jgi:hypothetical protein
VTGKNVTLIRILRQGRCECPVPEIAGILLRSKWAVGKRREEGAYLNRYPTDEQRGRRPIFIATLWAGASWLFFLRRGGSTRMTQIWVLRSRLEKQPTDLRQYTCYFGDRTLGTLPRKYGIALHAGRAPARSDVECPINGMTAKAIWRCDAGSRGSASLTV